MVRKKTSSIIQQQFAELGVHQQLNQAQLTIEELTAELERLKQLGDKQQEKDTVSQLHHSLQGQGLLELKIDAIAPNPKQPRQTFTHENLLLLARSLERDGLQQPLLVLAVNENEYFLVDGERRWRAAQLIGWQTIKAVVIPTTIENFDNNPELLRRQALLVNHHRENLNPLDLAEALCIEMEHSLGIKTSSSPKLLNTVVSRLARQEQLEIISSLVSATKEEQERMIEQWQQENLVKEEEAQVLLFLLSLQLNPISVKTNIFPTLKLFSDLKQAIRERGLGGHQARILQRLSASNLEKSVQESKKIRSKVVQEVIEKKLSVNATRKRVQEILEGNQEAPQISKAVQSLVTKIEQLAVEGLNETELKAISECLQDKLNLIQHHLKHE